MKRIKKFGVAQTAKVVATIYGVMALIFVIPMMIFGSFSGVTPFGGSYVMLLMPLAYWVLTFIMTAIGCFVYNIIAEKTGGIEIEVEVANEY